MHNGTPRGIVADKKEQVPAACLHAVTFCVIRGAFMYREVFDRKAVLPPLPAVRAGRP
ncbi:hypothetical protein [Pseudomonas sp.]|uniref:hypothetical protein n=1 Tax=Pseudomonas sp. TaxID=306 RepID=UPI003D0C16F5